VHPYSFCADALLVVRSMIMIMMIIMIITLASHSAN
jgi:hypothetical protein